ncbi:septum site-determining protein MinC [Oceanobacillus sp. CAU 1775]
MQENKQLITIKGTREGLTLFISDDASFDEALKELEEKLLLTKHNREEPVVPVSVQSGNRYLDDTKRQTLKDVIEKDQNFVIESIEANVIHLDDAIRWKDESEIKLEKRVIRSGQVLKVTGDLLLIGDVNPGGKVMATGNIYIIGHLYGIAHAGYSGDRNTFIAASYMKPTQLRIADFISRAPDYESDGVYMECGFIDGEEDKIIIDRIQLLSQLRDDVNRFERRIQNG